METFFLKYEEVVVEPQRLLALDVALQATPARWWTVHKESIDSWEQCRRLMTVGFGVITDSFTEHYSGLTDPGEHLLTCGYRWSDVPREGWTHMFVHTLDVVPREWYAQLELRRETSTWETMTLRFVHTFDAWEGELMIESAL